jgi:hypothetical protein
MIDSPWNATSFKQHRTETLASELMIAQANGRGIVQDGDNVLIVSPHADKVPTFNIPITRHEMGTRKVANPNAVFIDGRSFMRKDQNQPGGVVTNNQTQYDFVFRVAELTAFWVEKEESRMDLIRAGDLPATVFISWVSHAVNKYLGIDEETARSMQILTGIYYAHLYHDAGEASSARGKATIAKLVHRWTRHPADLVFDMVENVEYMASLGDYIETARKLFPQNTRMAMVNAGLLVTILNKSWFGFGAEDLINAGVEYPPIFLALVEAAANSKVWRKSGLGMLVERFVTGSNAAEFSKNMSVLVGRPRYPAVR